MWLTPNGLGNRVAEIIAGITMADELRCAFLFDREGFVRASMHSNSYEDAMRYLNIDADFLEYKEVAHNITSQVVMHDWPWPRQPERCGTLYSLRTTQVCRFKDNNYQTWCTYAANYDAVKWRLRERFYRVPRYDKMRSRRTLTVAWHLRTGDIAPDRTNRRFYEALRDELRHIRRASRLFVDVHFVYSGTNGTHFPDDYAFLRELVCNETVRCVLHADASPIDSLQTMTLGADLLITSRSSFSYIASLYTKALVLFETPKEQCGNCYYVSEAFRVDTDGRILQQDEFRTRLALFVTRVKR